MPLPFKLDHINLWLIKESDGWTLIDTGINNKITKRLWVKALVKMSPWGKLKRLICTHSHPDHMGLAGWFCSKYGIDLFCTQGEWAMGNKFSNAREDEEEEFRAFFRSAGCTKDQIEILTMHGLQSSKFFEPVPNDFTNICDKDLITIGDKTWKVIVGEGHSIEQATFYCEEIKVLISGDQILTRITPTITLLANNQKSDPLRAFLQSNKKYQSLPIETRVLPSHNQPFTGLHERLNQYERHHSDRLEETYKACGNGVTATEISNGMFSSSGDPYHSFFSISETLSHLRYLDTAGSIGVQKEGEVDIYFQLK